MLILLRDDDSIEKDLNILNSLVVEDKAILLSFGLKINLKKIGLSMKKGANIE